MHIKVKIVFFLCKRNDLDSISFIFQAIWYDIQLIMGGHRMMISPDEPIIAAMALYIDIMTLFLYIVQIWQSCSE